MNTEKYMKKYFFSIIVILFILNIGFNIRASNLTEDKYFYIVQNVKIENLIEEETENIRQKALNEVKRKAFDEILNKLGHQEIVVSDDNLNSFINGYKIVDEYYDNEYYSIVANFNFNKSLVKDMIESSLNKNKDENNKGRIVNAVVILTENYDIVGEYSALKNWLVKNKILYKPLQITKNQVQIKLINVYEDTIYKTLRKLNLNGSMYLE